MSESRVADPVTQQRSLSMMERQRNLLGLRVEDWTMTELISVLDQAIVHRTPVHVWGINVPLFAMVRSIPDIVDFTHQFDIVIADGAGIPIFGRFMGQHIRAHVGTPYVAAEMIKLAARKGYRLLLFGATPEVNAEAGRRLLAQYPSLSLCPGIDGYYPVESEAEIALRIRDLKPDILLVGMALPKKERFLLRWRDFMQVPVGIACGGYLDILADKTTLAPKLVERLAMSWLWRFILEPRRMFSKMLMGGILFLFYIFPVALIMRLIAPQRSLCILDLFPSSRSH